MKIRLDNGVSIDLHLRDGQFVAHLRQDDSRIVERSGSTVEEAFDKVVEAYADQICSHRTTV